MYLSKLELGSTVTRNPYNIHRELWNLFPNDGSKERDFLFRVDWRGAGGPQSALLYSADAPRPDVSSLVRLVGTREARLTIRRGQVLRFALTANVVKRLNQERSRVPLVRHEERIAWLQRKLDPSAEIAEADVVGSRTLTFRKKSVPGKIDVVEFSGVLVVKEPDELLRTMARGIGPAKSFGCGLLTLARA